MELKILELCQHLCRKTPIESFRILCHGHFGFDQLSILFHSTPSYIMTNVMRSFKLRSRQDDLTKSSKVINHYHDVLLSSKRFCSCWTHKIDMKKLERSSYGYGQGGMVLSFCLFSKLTCS